MNRAWLWSACACWSAGRSRGSWIDSAATITSTSRSEPFSEAATSMRASRGSTGSGAIARPTAVSRLRGSTACGSTAWSSSSSRRPSVICRASGGSTNGKRAMSPRPSEVICRMTEARLVRWISGSVNSGRDAKSSSE